MLTFLLLGIRLYIYHRRRILTLKICYVLLSPRKSICLIVKIFLYLSVSFPSLRFTSPSNSDCQDLYISVSFLLPILTVLVLRGCLTRLLNFPCLLLLPKSICQRQILYFAVKLLSSNTSPSNYYCQNLYISVSFLLPMLTFLFRCCRLR
jgi:hypothetical protein